MGGQEQQIPGGVSQRSMNRVDNEGGGARSRGDERGEHSMSISGKGYRRRDSRAPTHFAATSDQWKAENVGADLATLAALIAYFSGSDSQWAYLF